MADSKQRWFMSEEGTALCLLHQRSYAWFIGSDETDFAPGQSTAASSVEEGLWQGRSSAGL